VSRPSPPAIHTGLVACLSLGAAAVLAACSGGAGAVIQAPVVTVDLPAPASDGGPPAKSLAPVASPLPAAGGLAAYAGRYRITGAARSDGCGGALYLAARHIEVLPSRLEADVVNRTYDARLREDASALVAEGEFDASTCAGGRMHEKWTLAPSREGLEGVLVSEWPMPPDCGKRCRVEFSIHAVRLIEREAR
jgi:hypothetical protein